MTQPIIDPVQASISRAFVRLWLLLCLAFCTVCAQAEAPRIELPVQGVIADLKSRALVLPDPEQRYSAAELMATDPGFEPFDASLNQTAPPSWLKLELVAHPDANSNHVLRVSRRFFARFDLYTEAPDGRLVQRSATVNEVIDARTVGREFIFDLALDPGQPTTLLIHVEAYQGSLQPLELWLQDGASFAENQATTYLVFGLIFGVLFALIFHNFILYLNLRQPGHLFYVLAMSSMLLLLGIDSGMLQNYLLPEFLLGAVARINVLLVALLVATHFLFFRVFTSARDYSPRLVAFTTAMVALTAVLAVVQLLAPGALFIGMATITQLLAVSIFFLMLIGAWKAGRKGAVEGYIFLIAWGIYVVSALVRTLLSLDFAIRNPVFEYLMYFAAVAEASILALGLAYRVRVLYQRHATALREQHKAAMLANTDSLTQAYNRRFLQSYLGNLLNERDHGSLDRAVLILDLDNFKHANDTYGHAAGDIILRELVRRCRSVLAEDEVICRLGGDEFVIVMRDQESRRARVVADEIVQALARRPFRYEQQDIPITTSIGMVSCISASSTFSEVLRMADQALYQAKQAGRNQAVLFDPDQATPFRHGPSMEVPRENQT